MIAAMVAKPNSMAIAVRTADSGLETHHWGAIQPDKWPAHIAHAASLIDDWHSTSAGPLTLAVLARSDQELRAVELYSRLRDRLGIYAGGVVDVQSADQVDMNEQAAALRPEGAHWTDLERQAVATLLTAETLEVTA